LALKIRPVHKNFFLRTAFFHHQMAKKIKTVAVIVAHPDDETLWAGGTILNNPDWLCFVICLSHKSNIERAAKFTEALKALGAHGMMGDLDDGPEQKPLSDNEVQETILQLMPPLHFDLIISHSINGEYTRHRRHEEVGRAVIKLWCTGRLTADQLWAFAYEDGHRAYHPITIEDASIYNSLPPDIWENKYSIITDIYDFDKNSWEAQTTPREEAFWEFLSPAEAQQWLVDGYMPIQVE